MKCGVHNFYHNFCNASGGNDVEFLQSMIVDEVTKLIADKGPEFTKALINSGIQINPISGVRENTIAFLDNINKSAVQRNVALLILDNNGIPHSTRLRGYDALEMLNADGSTIKNIKETLKDKDALNEVINSISGIADSFNGKDGQKIKEEIKNDILESIHDTTTPKFPFGCVVKFVALVSILSYAGTKIYKYYKLKNTKS